MAKIDLITPELVREFLDYDPSSGDFIYKFRSADSFTDFHQSSERKAKSYNTRYGGKTPYYSFVDGYAYISLQNQKCKAHRLAWMHVYGDIPQGIEIDHINGNKSDNRISNLRLATRSENCRNSKLSPLNTSGSKGVSWNKARNKWTAQIKINGRQKHLGVFKNVEDAKSAYAIAAVASYGEFARF
jgi:hypothetical protein